MGFPGNRGPEAVGHWQGSEPCHKYEVDCPAHAAALLCARLHFSIGEPSRRKSRRVVLCVAQNVPTGAAFTRQVGHQCRCRVGPEVLECLALKQHFGGGCLERRVPVPRQANSRCSPSLSTSGRRLQLRGPQSLRPVPPIRMYMCHLTSMQCRRKRKTKQPRRTGWQCKQRKHRREQKMGNPILETCPSCPWRAERVCRAGRQAGDGMGGPCHGSPSPDSGSMIGLPCRRSSLAWNRLNLRRPSAAQGSCGLPCLHCPQPISCSRGRLRTSNSPFAHSFLPGLRSSL